MYIIKVKSAESSSWLWACSTNLSGKTSFVEESSIKEDLARRGRLPPRCSIDSLSEAKKAYNAIIFKLGDSLKCCKIVELSSYDPHPEMQVIDFWEKRE